MEEAQTKVWASIVKRDIPRVSLLTFSSSRERWSECI